MEPTNFRTTDRWNSVPVPERVAERAYTRVDVDENGCWISRYSVASHGYSQIGWNDKGTGRFVVLGHRAAWVHINGQVPVGMTLDHVCKVRRCVNPDHLRLLSNYENARRTHGEDWAFGTCANGHSNMFLRDDPHRKTKSGNPRIGRRCIKCAAMYSARASWRKWRGLPYPSHLLLASEIAALNPKEVAA